MNYLVDTHAFLWYFSEDPRLGKNAEEIHDRIIVATAKITNSTILTKDQEIRTLKNVKVVW